MTSKPKPICKYGAACYRKNPDHLRQFAHPDREGKVEGAGRELKTATPPKLEGPVAATTVTSLYGKRESQSAEREDGSPPAKRPRREKTGEGHEGRDGHDGGDGHYGGVLVSKGSHGAATERPSPVDAEELARESSDVRENVKRKFLVDMPEDFYQFWDFCKMLNPACPEAALEPSLGLLLGGPYHVLAGRLRGVPWQRCVLHHRYFYDPPEFLTVITGDETTGFHIGYFRDDPKSTRCFVASNCAQVNCEIQPEAENIFAAVKIQIASKLKDKSLSEEQKRNIMELEAKLVSEVKKLRLELGDPKALAKQRRKDVLAKCFHKIGIIVPYDKNTELGYRPLPMNDRELQRLLDKIASFTDPVKREKHFEALQEIVTFVQFANDECDYGMGLELGLDLFCHGDQFHNVVLHLLPLAYELLGRDVFKEIIQEHLKCRNRVPIDFSVNSSCDRC